jgi:hypothetical protein
LALLRIASWRAPALRTAALRRTSVMTRTECAGKEGESSPKGGDGFMESMKWSLRRAVSAGGGEHGRLTAGTAATTTRLIASHRIEGLIVFCRSCRRVCHSITGRLESRLLFPFPVRIIGKGHSGHPVEVFFWPLSRSWELGCSCKRACSPPARFFIQMRQR